MSTTKKGRKQKTPKRWNEFARWPDHSDEEGEIHNISGEIPLDNDSFETGSSDVSNPDDEKSTEVQVNDEFVPVGDIISTSMAGRNIFEDFMGGDGLCLLSSVTEPNLTPDTPTTLVDSEVGDKVHEFQDSEREKSNISLNVFPAWESQTLELPPENIPDSESDASEQEEFENLEEDHGDTDEEKDEEYYEAKNVRELKDMCRKRGLMVGGTKPVLIKKLIRDDQGISTNLQPSSRPTKKARADKVMEAVKRVMGESDSPSSDGAQDPKQEEANESLNSPEIKKIRTETPEELTNKGTKQEDEAEKEKDVAMETTEEQKAQSSVDEGEKQKASSQSEICEAEMPRMQPEDVPSGTDSIETESLKIRERRDEEEKEVLELQSTSAEVHPTGGEVDVNNESCSGKQIESSSSAEKSCEVIVDEAPASSSLVDAKVSSPNTTVDAKVSSSFSSSHADTDASPSNLPIDKWKAQSDAVINFLLDNRDDIDKVRNFHFIGKTKTPPSDSESVAKKPRKLKKIKQPSQSLTVSNDAPLELHQQQQVQQQMQQQTQQPIRRGFKLVVSSKAKGKKKKPSKVPQIATKEVAPENGQSNSSIASVAVPLSHYANQQQQLSPSSQNRLEGISSGKSTPPGSSSLVVLLKDGKESFSAGKSEGHSSSLVISIDSHSKESTDEWEKDEEDKVVSEELSRRSSRSQSEVFVDEEIEMQQIPNVIVDSEVSMPELARSARTPKKKNSQQQQQKRAEYSPSGRKLPPPPIILRDIKDQQRMPPYPNVSFSPPRYPETTESFQMPPQQRVQMNPFNPTSVPTRHAFSQHAFASNFQQQRYPAYGQPRMMPPIGIAPLSSTQQATMTFPYYNMMRQPMMGSQANSLSQSQFMNVRPSRPSYPQYLPNNYHP